MLKVLINRPAVLALSFRGHLSREDIGECFTLLEPSLAGPEKLNLLVEAIGLSGIDSEVLFEDLGRGLRLMLKLERFGRVAIVADQDWIRFLSRVESALLPGISYRTYLGHERVQALDWVEGRDALPYGQSLRIIESGRPDVIAVEVDGRIAAEEVGKFAAELNRIRAERPLKGLLARVRSVGTVDPGIVLDSEYLRMKLGFLRELERYAVVGGPGWLADWIDFVRPLVRMELRHFPASAEADAWEWLGAKPPVDEPLAA